MPERDGKKFFVVEKKKRCKKIKILSIAASIKNFSHLFKPFFTITVRFDSMLMLVIIVRELHNVSASEIFFWKVWGRGKGGMYGDGVREQLKLKQKLNQLEKNSYPLYGVVFCNGQ